MKAYHLSPCMLNPDSIILPGNWGRMLNLYVTPIADINSANILLRETIFENIRALYYPTLPSRLQSLFCCPTLEGARYFQDTQVRRFDLIYEIEIPQDGIFYASWDHVNLPDGNFLALESYQRLAHQYWSTDWQHIESAQQTLEMLSPYPARIVQRIH